jgi:hypothetical protein
VKDGRPLPGEILGEKGKNLRILKRWEINDSSTKIRRYEKSS